MWTRYSRYMKKNNNRIYLKQKKNQVMHMTIQAVQGQLTGCSCSWCMLRVAQATKSVKSAAVMDHSSLLYASAVHSCRPCSRQYLRKTSSHFIHCRRDGRLGRFESISSARRCQSESRQVVTRQVQASFDFRATCPAHDHFARKCAHVSRSSGPYSTLSS